MLPVITGYAAKDLCSCIFVENRPEPEVQQSDLRFFPVNIAVEEVDTVKKEVVSTFLGMSPRTAKFRPGMGCSLVNDKGSYLKREIAERYANPDNVRPWPFGDRLADTVMAGVDYDVLGEQIELAFQKTGRLGEPVTRAIVVVYQGQIVGEKYLEGFDRSTVLLGWSMTKSVMNAFIGILVGEENIDLDQPVPIAAWANDDRSKITWKHLLQMNSGLHWREDYNRISDATKMLFLEPDAYQFAINSKLQNDPGSSWEYSSGNSNILSGLVRQILDDDEGYWNFPYERLFNPLGMKSAIIETDEAGNFIGSSFMHATPRDWAKFGLLFLQNGIWDGEEILPGDWVEFSRETAFDSNQKYGAHFWINGNKHLPDVPETSFSSNGHRGQRITIVPSHELVIVRMGADSSEEFDFNSLISGIMSSIDPAGSG